MRFPKLFSAFLALLLFSASAQGQLQYIGLKGISDVREAQRNSTASVTYWSELQLLDSFLYIPTSSGLYRKSVATLQDTTWQLYAFGGFPIKTFVKKNDTVLAATGIEGNANLLLLSTDNGVSFTDQTTPALLNNQASSIVIRMGQNPRNPNSLVILNQRSGMLKSTDFGLTWTQLNPFLGGYQDWFSRFNPNDTTNLFYTGEEIFFRSYVQATYDNGNTWKKVDSLQTHCTHGIAFHPTNKDVMVSYGEGRIAKSIDQGRSWSTTGNLPLYIFKALYDPQNPDVLYATGNVTGTGNTLVIYQSLDGGTSWSPFYQEMMPNSDGIMDIALYQNKLLVYTLKNGVFFLDLNPQSVSHVRKGSVDVHISPNPVENSVKIQSTARIKSLSLYDLAGRLHLHTDENEEVATLNLQSLPIGTYQLVVNSDSGVMSMSLLKK